MAVYRRWIAVMAALAGLAFLPGHRAGAAAQEAPGGGGKICYSLKEGDSYLLHVMDADGKNDRVLPNQPGKVNVMPAWTRDGKKIAFMSGDSERGMSYGLYTMNSDGTGLQRLAENETLAGLPAWSPDGKQILYIVFRAMGPRLVSANADGSNAKELESGLKFSFAPFFSPDGKSIAFSGGNEEKPENAGLYTAQPDGSGAQKLPVQQGFVVGGPGSWSPDGKKIAFVVGNPPAKDGQLRIFEIAEKIDSRVTDVKIGEGGPTGIPFPSWSPDGKWLLVSQPADGGKSVLLRISLDGKTQEPAAPAVTSAYCPVWFK